MNNKMHRSRIHDSLASAYPCVMRRHEALQRQADLQRNAAMQGRSQTFGRGGGAERGNRK